MAQRAYIHGNRQTPDRMVTESQPVEKPAGRTASPAPAGTPPKPRPKTARELLEEEREAKENAERLLGPGSDALTVRW